MAALDDPRTHARALAWARLALGVTALAAPTVPGRPWVGDAAATPAGKTLARALGGRDVALGLGTLLALNHDAPVRGWLEASALADACDVGATLAAFGRLPRWGRLLVMAAASGGAISCAVTARRLS
jgi:hypothetical protein